MEPPRIPVAREFFAQWRRNRGDRNTPAARAFSRRWEALLEDAGIVSAVDRQDAVRDARLLANEGWVELKAVRYRANEIDQISLPLVMEERWRAAFGFVRAADNPDAARIAAHAWQPPLAFVRDGRIGLRFEEIARIDAFLAGLSAQTPPPFVPLKERSLELFGDEKRLDALLATALFRDDRLTLDHLRCFSIPEPLGWQRGLRPDGPVIVIENLSTWHTYVEWDKIRPRFSAVIYGGGNRFVDGVLFLRQIFAELGGGPRPVRYFGDLDAAGLRIPRRASQRAVTAGLPAVEPHDESYRWLLDMAAVATAGEVVDDNAGVREDCNWLGEFAEQGWKLISAGKRLAQERIGWEFVSRY